MLVEDSLKNRVTFCLYGIIYFVVLLLVQGLASGIGFSASDLFSYKLIDPYNVFARISVHHIIQMLIGLLIILILKVKYKQEDFGLKLGNIRTGFSHVIIFSILIALFLVAQNAYLYATMPNIGYDYPLNARNILGSLAFQMFLSGPSEEILFRAIPLTLFLLLFKKSVRIKYVISVEVVLAALLFAFAHLNAFELDFQIFYSFILGIAFGVAYQNTGSILYPMLMHSISNLLSVGIGYLFYFFSC